MLRRHFAVCSLPNVPQVAVLLFFLSFCQRKHFGSDLIYSPKDHDAHPHAQPNHLAQPKPCILINICGSYCSSITICTAEYHACSNCACGDAAPFVFATRLRPRDVPRVKDERAGCTLHGCPLHVRRRRTRIVQGERPARWWLRRQSGKAAEQQPHHTTRHTHDRVHALVHRPTISLHRTGTGCACWTRHRQRHRKLPPASRLARIDSILT